MTFEHFEVICNMRLKLSIYLFSFRNAIEMEKNIILIILLEKLSVSSFLKLIQHLPYVIKV